jgi:hypothetical protein
LLSIGVLFQPIPVCGSGGSCPSAAFNALVSSGPHVIGEAPGSDDDAAGDEAGGPADDGAACDGGAVTVTVDGVVSDDPHELTSATADPPTISVSLRHMVGVWHEWKATRSYNEGSGSLR